jgi:predicted RNase H-like nuclease (RuvC/YqgF family)
MQDLELQVKDLEKQTDTLQASNKQLSSDLSEKENKVSRLSEGTNSEVDHMIIIAKITLQVFELSKELSEVKDERASLQEEVEKLRKSEKETNQEKRYLEEQLEASRSNAGTSSDKADQSVECVFFSSF